MKNILLTMAALAAFLITSCDKDHDNTTSILPEADGARVTIFLAGTDDDSTRGFFDTTAKAETWESQINSLSVFAFDNADRMLIRRDFTSAEITAKSATFALPKSAAGTSCTFYGIANYNTSSAKTKSALLALLENIAADYNGTFAEVSAHAKRPGGFVMSGMIAKSIGAVNSTTNVGITLKRSVAKIAVQTTIAPSFADKYSGSLTINSVNLSKAASQSLVFAGSVPNTGAMSFIHAQTPTAESGKYNNLFYSYENGPLTAGNRVLVEINATYDTDGNTATTDDRSDVTYSVELDGSTGGAILRNGYYRLAVNITGLVGQDCQISISVADWEVPATQNVDLGA